MCVCCELCYVLEASLWHEKWVLGRDLTSLNSPDFTSLCCVWNQENSRKLDEQDYMTGCLNSRVVSFGFS